MRSTLYSVSRVVLEVLCKQAMSHVVPDRRSRDSCASSSCAREVVRQTCSRSSRTSRAANPSGINRYEGSIIIGYDFRKFDGVDVLDQFR